MLHTTMEKTAKGLVMIEFQNDWLAPNAKLNGYLQDRDQLETAVRNTKTILAHARQHDWHVLHVPYAFSPGYLEFGAEPVGMWGLIKQTNTFVADTPGSAFHEDFTPATGEFVVTGRTGVSAFVGSNLDTYLRTNDLREIYLAGFAMHACVESTLRQAHDLGYRATLLSDASATFTAAMRDHILENVVYAFGSQATTAETITA